jgi:RNA polymerase sigma factor (TIGR02999 family)
MGPKPDMDGRFICSTIQRGFDQSLTKESSSVIHVLMQHPVDRRGMIDGSGRGAANSVDAVFAATYQELRKLARLRLRGGGRNTVLDTTSLVHESYLRLAAAGRLRIEDRIHFLRYAGCAMRSVVIDFVRQRQSARRGGAADRITLTTWAGVGVNAGEREILRVHEAITELNKYDARMAQVVEMRYFGGLTEAEIAEALEVTDRTVRRDWEKARLWLSEALK